jgi:hypothetical protein
MTNLNTTKMHFKVYFNTSTIPSAVHARASDGTVKLLKTAITVVAIIIGVVTNLLLGVP